MYILNWFIGWQKSKRCHKFTKLYVIYINYVILRLFFCLNFFTFFRLFFRHIKVVPKVSEYSYAPRVTLWNKLAFHIAFSTFNFQEGIFILKPYVHLLCFVGNAGCRDRCRGDRGSWGRSWDSAFGLAIYCRKVLPFMFVSVIASTVYCMQGCEYR